MFVLRLGSTCSFQISDDMLPRKKRKTSSKVVKDVSPESKSSSGCDWRKDCTSLHAKYDYILKNNILSDVKLVVGEEGILFDCHRLILAFGSPVFESMFFGDLAETGDTITIPDVDPEGFHHLIRFLYTGEFSMPNAVTAFKAYFAADKYCVAVPKELCEEYLCNCSVTSSNVWLFFENSLFLNSQAIRESCLLKVSNALRHHLRPSLEEGSFLDISLQTLESLLGLDNLKAPEEVILKSVIRWAEHKSETTTSLSFESILKPLLSNVHFGALSAKEFADLRCTTRLKEVVNKDDSLSILEHLLNPTLCPLPNWCSPKRKCCSSLSGTPKMPEGQLFPKHRRRNYSSSSSSTTTSSDSSTSSTDD